MDRQEPGAGDASRRPRPDAPPAGFTLETADGSLRVAIVYREPRMNTSFDPALLTLTVPQDVRIQDFR